MKTVNKNELNILPNMPVKSGCNALVKICQYNGKIYAYKDLYEPSEILTPENIHKFECLSSLNKKFINSPSYIVKDDVSETSIGYLTEYLKGPTLSDLCGESNIIIDLLKESSENLHIMHELGIIHCDISDSNIINSCFLDFDGSFYRGFKPELKNIRKYEKKFVTKYGLSPELDIAMFNLLTYKILSRILYEGDAFEAIENDKFGIFKTDEQIEILKNLLLKDDKPTNKLLINTLR